MKMTDMNLEVLLPHRSPMILIDAVESFSAAEKRAVAKVTIGENQLFLERDGVPAWVAIEYMAQTAAALVGLRDQAEGRKVRVGFLLGTRRLSLSLENFAVGETYFISAKCIFEDDEAATFECSIANAAGVEAASALLNAYRPRNVETFLTEQAAK